MAVYYVALLLYYYRHFYRGMPCRIRLDGLQYSSTAGPTRFRNTSRYRGYALRYRYRYVT